VITVRGVPKIKVVVPNVDALTAQMASDVSKKIRDRTSKGNDVNNTPFQKYSDAYILYKKKEYGVGSKVNMRAKGTMIESVKPIKMGVGWHRVLVNDNNRALIGWAHQTGGGNVPVRQWFGINKADGDLIFKARSRGVNIAEFVK